MSIGELKAEFDFSSIVTEKVLHCEKLFKENKLQEIIEILLQLEKQTRTANDAHSTARVLVAIIKFCYQAGDFNALNENIHLLSKRRSQLKQAVTKMVQEAFTYVDQIQDMERKLQLIDTLRTVSSGKIYVEIERARLTRKLANIKEAEGKIDESATLLQELQVETYGSMEKREKIEFLLEQMRMCLHKNDFIRTQIISRKINIRSFEDESYHDQKLKYYEYMIKLDQHDSSYFNIFKHFKHIYDTPCIKNNVVHMKEALRNVVIYLLLSPFNNEQHDALCRLYEDKNLREMPEYFELLKLFKTGEIINWRSLVIHFENDLKVGKETLPATNAFKDSDGSKRWNDFKTRIVEHNMRVMAKYYTRIHTKRMASLLDLSQEETEEFLSSLVVNKTIHAKIDRLVGIVTFEKKKDPNDILNEWSNNLNTLMSTINKTTHLINKEEMVYAVKC